MMKHGFSMRPLSPPQKYAQGTQLFSLSNTSSNGRRNKKGVNIVLAFITQKRGLAGKRWFDVQLATFTVPLFEKFLDV